MEKNPSISEPASESTKVLTESKTSLLKKSIFSLVNRSPIKTYSVLAESPGLPTR